MKNFDRNDKRGGKRGPINFKKRDFGRDDKRRFDDRGSGRTQMHDAVCDKCHKDCEVPFRPTDGKPIFCSNCFDKGGKPGGQKTDDFKKQFETLNFKLDKILKALDITPTDKTAEKPKPVKKVVKSRKAVIKKKATPKKKKTKVAKKTVAKKKAAPKKAKKKK